MKFSRFLISELLRITVAALCFALWCIFAWMSGAEAWLIAVTACGFVLVAAVWLAAKYVAANRRIKKIARILSELKEGYLLGETLPEPYDAVEWEYFNVMKGISRSAVGKIEELSASQEEYREFIEKWIHEIKTPLTSCALLLKNGGAPAAMRAELKRADNLAESVLYYVRLRTQDRDVKILDASLRATVQGAVREVTDLLIPAGISVEVEGDGQVATDHKAVAFSVRQLLVNCAKYCKGCKVRIFVSPEKLTVCDDGCGIPPHELPRIFDRGFVGEAGRKRGNGTGMGLYLVKRTCGNIGIEVTARSEQGKYTRFTFSFAR